ncbi:helix-hairpin-helix domain-containing protein [Sphingomonas sp. TREG-RG-20F-R18-01]|uniref:helix-hairpin-helix domain-containing protein n=1 Tax=Sphingomonas sp. TREG-RG-20F-R18-01 TaxID=2914982 RepID=UPI001F58C2DB|nr:helix-hairpin-helix domain-containing protein [Sphingomonas sp. TREG-RG-20F-R18-01]
MAATPDNPNQAIDFMVPITTVHVALMVVLAVLAVATIVWGSMLARRRRNARKQVQENFEVAEAHGATHEPTVSADGTEVATLSSDVPERSSQDTDRQAPVAARTPEDAPPPRAVPSPAPSPTPAPVAIAAPTPAPAAASAAAPLAATGGLTQIKGLGPKLAATLAEQGITRVDQIAALSPSDAEALDAKLGAFRGRMTRDRWIEQAKLLSAGDRAGYEAQFGKLGG